MHEEIETQYRLPAIIEMVAIYTLECLMSNRQENAISYIFVFPLAVHQGLVLRLDPNES
jgi:hypothetical protein